MPNKSKVYFAYFSSRRMTEDNYTLMNPIVFRTAELYLNHHCADVHFLFEVNGNVLRIPAHKSVLAAFSSTFESMLSGPRKVSGDIKIVDFIVGAFEVFLQFFYLRTVQLPKKHAKEVLELADQYNVHDHVKKCIEYNQEPLTLGNICLNYQWSIHLNDEVRQKQCEIYISAFPKGVF